MNESELRELIRNVPGRWGAMDQFPRGTVVLPHLDDHITISEPILLAPRVGLRSADPHSYEVKGLLASSDFPAGRPLLETLLGYSNTIANGNFATTLENLCIYHRGIIFRGAQCSTLRNNYIKAPDSDGITIAPGSTRVWIESNTVQGSFSGAGILIQKSRPISGANNHYHRLDFGLVVDASHSIHLFGETHEKVKLPVTVKRGSYDVDIHIHAQRTSEIVVDLTGAGVGVVVRGMVRKSPKNLYWRDRDGRVRPFGKSLFNRKSWIRGDSASDRGAVFRVQL